MMNSSDEDNKKEDLSMPGIPGMPGMGGGMPRPNPFAGDDMDVDFRKPPKKETNVPDFLTRKTDDDNKEESSLPKIPDFETFKKQMEASAFGAFDDDDDVAVPPKKAEPVIPPVSKKDEVDDDDDDLGFDVDELVKKIDAKIAELEAEEKRNKEKEEAEKKAASIPSVTSTPMSTIERLPEEVIEREFDNKYEEKVEENYISKPIKPLGEEVKKPSNVNLNLDDDSEDDDFFDDFFDN